MTRLHLSCYRPSRFACPIFGNRRDGVLFCPAPFLDRTGTPYLIDRGFRVLFTRTSDLVQRLQAARRDLRLPAELTRFDRFDLLVLDDISYVRRDQSETSVLFELIAERYERRSVALTANQSFSAWDRLFPDAAMTLATVDGLVHHTTMEMNLKSYRRKFQLLLLTGVRRGELTDARVVDLDLAGARLKIADTKSRRPHVVLLSKETMGIVGERVGRETTDRTLIRSRWRSS